MQDKEFFILLNIILFRFSADEKSLNTRQKRHFHYLHPMRWTVDFKISKSPFPISHQSKILSMGSCFAKTIGYRMQAAKFDILVNPFGTIFHPLILAELLDHALFQDSMDKQGVLQREELFFHYTAHSDLRARSKEALKQSYESQVAAMHDYLKSGTHLILTFGTAWIYEHETFGRVANCHKQPQSLFRKRLADLEEMTLSLSHVFGNFSRVFPDLKIILTVSPVRHVKDGISENQLSKSLLRVLCSQLENKLSNVSYFPSYEILMDELRDYRFYKSDLIHPTEEAEDYIWEKWQQSFFSENTRNKLDEIRKVQLEIAHRPFNPESASHRKFLQNLLAKLERLNAEFEFSEEIQSTKSRLIS